MTSRDDDEAFSEAADVVAERLRSGVTPAEATEELIGSGVPADLAARLVGHANENLHRLGSAKPMPPVHPPGSAPSEERPIDLTERFPDFRPISSVPSLFTLNGFGLGMYGSRDNDPETMSHVKTHCLCAVFIPVLAIGAYRVINAPSGCWYFLGKERLSGFAKFWNILVLVGVLAAIAASVWSGYVDSPEYKAKQALKKADAAIARGELVEASRHLLDAAQRPTPQARIAAERLHELVPKLSDANVSVADANAFFMNIVHVHRARGGFQDDFDAAAKIARANAADHPVESMQLIRTASGLNEEKASAAAIEHVNGPVGAPAPGPTNELFETAAQVVSTPESKAKLFDAATPHMARLAGIDMTAAATLMKTVAPLAGPARVAEALSELLTDRLQRLPLAEARTMAETLWPALPAEARQVLLQASVAEAERRSEERPRTRLEFLDVFTFEDARDAKELNAVRRRLLEEIVESDPADSDAATRLAGLLEREGETERVVALLSPHRAKLGDAEGARILGQALARQGNLDESYALLQPYVEKRLETVHAAEKQFEESLQRIQQQVIDELRSGRAEGFNYSQAQMAVDEEKQRLIRDYLTSRMKSSPELAAANELMARSSGVVPVALDLGIVTLRRAQGMGDAGARKAELEKAEKVFLAVQGVAGEDARYRMSLGQVYYWLGKPDEGKALFDELLESEGRSYELLIRIASMLREIGATREARSLLEEAYRTTEEATLKHNAAHIRSMTSIDLEDRIEWLKKADPSSDAVRADLAASLAQKAVVKYDDAEAERQYREATRIYDSFPESTMSLNNGALSWVQLYAVSGDPEALRAAIQRLERSSALAPSDPIVLINLANSRYRLAISELCGPKIRLHKLRSNGSIAPLSTLFANAEEREEIRRRVRSNDNMKSALAMFDRVLVLSPKRLDAYATMSAVHQFLDEPEALVRLSERIRAARLDLDEINAQTLKSYEAETDEKREERRIGSGHFEKLMDEFRREGRVEEFALAVESRLSLGTATDLPSRRTHAEAMVKLAEEAHGMSPSMTARQTLMAAYAKRAMTTLAENDAAFLKAVEDSSRLLNDEALLAFALNGPEPLSGAARANPDAQAAIETQLGVIREFPDKSDALGWALLRKTQPEAAKELQERIAQPTSLMTAWLIAREFAPLNVQSAAHEQWRLRARGDHVVADALVESLTAGGVKVPVELFRVAGDD